MKLLRVTSLVLKIIIRLWRLEVDSEGLTAILLLKTMLQQLYPEEFAFLLDPSGRTFPRLVRDLDLLIDGEGLIRSGYRIVKSHHFSMELNILSCWLNITR